MKVTLARIVRHPIKSHSREVVAGARLTLGESMPWDRRWAVAHEAAKLGETPAWAPCVNFSIGSKAPSLMAISAELDEGRAALTLRHPARPDLSFRPDDAEDAARFIDWVRPISPADRALPVRLVALPGRGMTDTDYPSVSLINTASNAALGRQMGQELSPYRWRGNFWLDGLSPWEEFDLLGRHVRLGGAVLEVVERIVRCKATTANPATGIRDADTLAALAAGLGHQDFGVYARVVEGGAVATGDRLEIL